MADGRLLREALTRYRAAAVVHFAAFAYDLRESGDRHVVLFEQLRGLWRADGGADSGAEPAATVTLTAPAR
jgi:hypothetical protein